MRKLFLVVLLLSATGGFAQSLGWTELPNTKIRNVCPGENPNVAGNETSCHNIIVAWGGGANDNLRNRMLIWGGGHGDYNSNEIYAVHYSGTPSVERITEGCVASTYDEVCAGSNPPQPQARHTYDFLEVLPSTDEMFSWSHAWSNQSAWTFSLGPKQWSQVALGNIGLLLNAATVTATDPITGQLYLFDGIKLVRYSPSTRQFQQIGDAYNASTYTNGVIDPVRRLFLAIGGGYVYAFNVSGTTAGPLQQWSTSGGNPIVSCTAPGVDYDPGTDRIVGWCGGDTVYSLNLDTKVWTPLTFSGGPGPQQTWGTFGRWRYSSSVNAFVLVNSVDQNAFLFRTTAGDIQGPSIPSGVTATPVSPTQINISWQASTDNVGVTGYRVERCNPICSEIGQTANVTLSDTGLSGNQTYGYRVKAFDAAGNQSAYSTIASTTTPPVTRTVGPGKQYGSPCAAINAGDSGDLLVIDPSNYPGESCTLP